MSIYPVKSFIHSLCTGVDRVYYTVYKEGNYMIEYILIFGFFLVISSIRVIEGRLMEIIQILGDK